LRFIYGKGYYKLEEVIGLFERYNKELLIKLIDENRLKVEIHDGELSYNEKNEDLKTDYEFAKYFVEDATRGRESAYAYYQAVKIAIPKN